MRMLGNGLTGAVTLSATSQGRRGTGNITRPGPDLARISSTDLAGVNWKYFIQIGTSAAQK